MSGVPLVASLSSLRSWSGGRAVSSSCPWLYCYAGIPGFWSMATPGDSKQVKEETFFCNSAKRKRGVGSRQCKNMDKIKFPIAHPLSCKGFSPYNSPVRLE